MRGEGIYEAVRFNTSAGHKEKFPEIAQLIESREPEVRRFAFWALRSGLMPDLKITLPGLLKGLRDQVPSIRKEAYDSLIARKEDIRNLSKSGNNQTRKYAQDLLNKIQHLP